MWIIPRSAATLLSRSTQHALKDAAFEAVITEKSHCLTLTGETAAPVADAEGLQVVRGRDLAWGDLDLGVPAKLDCHEYKIENN